MCSVVALLICATLRLVPQLDDALSGRPAYMEAFSNVMASQVADALRGQDPIFVVQDENANCREVNDGSGPHSDDSIYVLSFSEQSRSLCLTVYGVVPISAALGAITVPPTLGRNYGRPLAAPAKAVALQRNLTKLTPVYLSLFHWRTKLARSGNIPAAKRERFPGKSAEMTSADITVNLLDLRAELARKHDTVNRILLFVILGSGLVLLYAVARLRLLYRLCLESCRGHGHEVRLREFLMGDVAVIAESARASYIRHQQDILAQARAEDARRRDKEDTRRRLQSFLETLKDAAVRQSVEHCLELDDIGQMQALLAELTGQAAQKTPEERLNVLLESLKEYCTVEEFDNCRAEVFQTLETGSFRDAREHAVAKHDQLRARAKELEKKEKVSGTPDISTNSWP